MKPDGFRRLALALPEAIESAHMSHPDFRVGGRIFATLGAPDAAHGMVKLKPDQQALFLRVDPAAFTLAAGAWGRRGSTLVRLASVKTGVLRDAIFLDGQYQDIFMMAIVRRPGTAEEAAAIHR